MEGRRPSRYNTKQQDAICAYLETLKGEHVTAGKIHECLKADGINIGVATVYRILDKLTERGKVRKYTFDNISGACYQLIQGERDCKTHYHLKCEDCGTLLHLNCSLLEEINRHVSDEHAFVINSMKTVFYGKCADCLNGTH